MTPPAVLPVQAKLSTVMSEQRHLNRATLIKPPAALRPEVASSGVSPTPFRPHNYIETIQNKLPHHQIPQTATLLIQRASSPYSSSILHKSKRAGAKLNPMSRKWMDIDKVGRRKLAWFSRNIQNKLGVPDKPAAGSICQMCGKPGISFELDHMTPWRHYVAAFMSKKYINKDGAIRGDAIKALYNDPENLWWICRNCNGPKSDIIPESKAHAAGNFSTGTTGRVANKASTLLPTAK
jgi:hypothetical protein